MKKYRRILAILAVLVMCATLCGCNAIDEMRALHAVQVSENTIRLNGSTYKLLPYCEQLYPDIRSDLDYVTLTKPDVPLLLADMAAEDFLDQSVDGRFLCGSWGENYYCIEKDYDEICDRIEEGFAPTDYFYDYYIFDDEEEETWGYTTHTYFLSDMEEQAIDKTLATGTPINTATTELIDYDHYVELYWGSEDGLFRESYLEIFLVDDTYLLAVPFEDETSSHIEVYTVDKEDTVFFDLLMEKAILADTTDLGLDWLEDDAYDTEM